jgi:uridine kinase
MRLERGDVLLLEGIHALNEELTHSVPASKKFKIFISALTQLNMDNHNRIPTSDTRLLRRIVRDNRFRGTDAATTSAQWPSVARGADAHIFPYQEQADAFFNSALIYEMSVLKQYAEPLLFRIDKSCPEYADARRLIKFLDGFVAGSDENVAINSILREFIGGSCFET